VTGGVLVVVALAMVSVLLWPGAVPAHVLGRARQRGPGQGTGAPGRLRGRRSRPDPGDVEAALAELLALVAAPLRVGVPPASSVAAAARAVAHDPVVGELTRRLVDTARAAEDVSAVWRAYAPGGEAAAFVARAWALSERTGAPLADALDAAEHVLRARRRTRQRLAAAAAGPRASMTVLVLLPLSGPVVGLACGISPRELYLESPLAVASLALGLVLALAAWTWSRAILARAAA